jgi:hypothetical protein
MTFWKSACLPIVLMGLGGPALCNCTGPSNVGVLGDCPALKDGNFGAMKFEGDAKSQAELKAFLETVYSLRTITVDIEKELIGSCGQLGKSIGMDEAMLKADPADGDGAKKVCGSVAEKIKSMMNPFAAGLELEVGEVKCEIDVDATQKCLEECGAKIPTAELGANCDGELLGKCDAECTGTCISLDARTCNAGACSGRCDGVCDGKKSAGLCKGKCTGKCSGGCGVQGKGTCDGLCAGGTSACTGTLKSPVCRGSFRAASVDAGCLLGCSAKLATSIKCPTPAVVVTIKTKGNKDLEALAKSLEGELPKIHTGTGRAVALAATLAAIGERATKLKQTLGPSIGATGASCLGQAAIMANTSMSSINVEIEATGNVDASLAPPKG